MSFCLNPSSQELAAYAATLEQEDAQVEQLLSSLGYERRVVPSALWNRYTDAARRHLFLLEPNDYQCDGVPKEHLLLHKVRFPNGVLASRFIEVMAAKNPSFQVSRCIQPVDCLDDHEVELTHQVLMTAPEVTRAACQILEIAHIYLAGNDYFWTPIDGAHPAPMPDPISFSEWPQRPSRVMRLRTEFYADLLLIRLILAPWVCRWTDVESQSHESVGREVAVTTLYGHEAEFEIANEIIGRDELRWLLNQAMDLHVAAQTLNYVDQYTGERLHYDYIDRIQPSEEALDEIHRRLTPVANTRNDIVHRLSGFLEDVVA